MAGCSISCGQVEKSRTVRRLRRNSILDIDPIARCSPRVSPHRNCPENHAEVCHCDSVGKPLSGFFTAEALRHRVDRVRSHLQAGVCHADLASGLNPGFFRALTGAATHTCSAVAAVCDRPVLLSSTCGIVMLPPCSGERTAFAERRYKSCLLGFCQTHLLRSFTAKPQS